MGAMTFLKPPTVDYTDVIFFDPTVCALRCHARLASTAMRSRSNLPDEDLRTSEDRNIFDLMSHRKSDEITLELTDDSTAN